MSEPFRTSRPDGRSDRIVIYELTAEAPVESLFTHGELIEALAEDLDIPVSRTRMYAAIIAANRTLLTEKRRFLAVVRDQGYRILRAEEHLPAAIDRKHRAASRLKQGMQLLRHADLGELTEAQRILHEGQLLIMSGLHDAIVESHRRHDRHEELIEEIRNRQKADYQELRDRVNQLETATIEPPDAAGHGWQA